MTATLLLLASLPGADPQPVADLKLPPGFTARLYSDQALANDIYTMTIDADGRVLVAGRGYVRVLVDDDGDGRADRAIDLIDGLKEGPMGLFAEGGSLYVVADGGLKRYRGYNGRDKLTQPPETIFKVKTGGEHHAHAVRRGPDGWLYFICGNMTGITKEMLDPLRSPVKEPVAGTLLRINPDGKTVECVADGMRNAYSFDFNLAGEPFTYDSDNERCIGLPWYEGCRFYHLVPGGNYGWRSPQLSQTWRKPPYFADVVPPIADLGRGSPTGVACYRHTQFPEKYRGGFFLADWTFGRVYFVPIRPKGSTYEGKPEVFLQPTGESGFAPTGLAVHPQTGELFISIGGRGTRGAVYRIRATGRQGEPKPMEMAKRSLEWDVKESRKQWLEDAVGEDTFKRRQALELMLRYREKMGYDQKLFDAVLRNLDHGDALIRAAAGRMAIEAAIPVTGIKPWRARLAVALAEAQIESERASKTALAALMERRGSTGDKLVAIRVMQLAFGDLTSSDSVGTVWEGYTFRRRAWPDARTVPTLLSFLCDNHLDPRLRREIGRTLAALGAQDASLPDQFLDPTDLTGENATIQEGVHNLAIVARVSGDPRNTGQVARRLAILLRLFQGNVESRSLDGFARDTNWPLRFAEIVSGLGKRYKNLPSEVLNDWGGAILTPEVIVVARELDLPRPKVARLLIDRLKDWTPATIAFLDSLPTDECRPLLARLWNRPGLKDSIIRILAAAPLPEDEPKLAVGLNSLDGDVVRDSAAALTLLPVSDDKVEVIAAIKALRRLSEDKANATTQSIVADLLSSRTGQTFGSDAAKWAAWFAKEHPELAAKLNAADGFDPAAWKVREARIPWADGDAVKGRLAFARATCTGCHDGGGAVGPSLAGVGKRFGRDDVLTAILQPSRDVSARYRPTRITTSDGKSYIGMIVYEATSGIILQTGPDATVRIAGSDIESQRTLESSLMPAGLLDKLTDREIADLVAYLRSLNEPVPK